MALGSLSRIIYHNLFCLLSPLLEFKSITNMRLLHIIGSPPNPSHFIVLVRAIPWCPDESYPDTLKKFLLYYHGSNYLSHQMVYNSGTVQKLKV
ncbi:hypothetical protein L6164_037468 [Bauhinia variegata]|uniref:Uncharacterized protein n=1 Tax=Bauhinia variegata TaxID=167791 RepID=A0ACB9KK63_BAUVA|nr:hypothetical protein L6164_037468 [Bauhinia variegata]